MIITKRPSSWLVLEDRVRRKGTGDRFSVSITRIVCDAVIVHVYTGVNRGLPLRGMSNVIVIVKPTQSFCCQPKVFSPPRMAAYDNPLTHTHSHVYLVSSAKKWVGKKKTSNLRIRKWRESQVACCIIISLSLSVSLCFVAFCPSKLSPLSSFLKKSPLFSVSLSPFCLAIFDRSLAVTMREQDANAEWRAVGGQLRLHDRTAFSKSETTLMVSSFLEEREKKKLPFHHLFSRFSKKITTTTTPFYTELLCDVIWADWMGPTLGVSSSSFIIVIYKESYQISLGDAGLYI